MLSIAIVFGVLTPIAALADHTDPTSPDLPLESPLTDATKNPGLELDCADGSDISALGNILADQLTIPPDRDVSGSENRVQPGTVAPDAIWANSTTYPGITTLDVSGSENVIHGRVVSRSHLNVAGSQNQFQHHTEYGLRSQSEEAFNVSGSDNCFSGPDADGAGTLYEPGEPVQVPRATPPQPDGFPVDFDLDNDGDFADTFAPGSAAALAALADPMPGNQYFTCLIGSSTIPAPLTCDTSTGKLSGSVQLTQMPTGLYYAEGEVDIAASNLDATVTIVSVGKMKISGSNESDFIAYTSGLLFMSDFGTVNSVVGDDALDVSGSTSEFEEGHIFAPNGRVTLGGSQNSFQCTVMGDRVTLNGSLLFINGVICGSTAATVVTDIHADLQGNDHFSLGQSGVVEVGTEVHDKVVVSSNSNANLTGPITLERFNNGTCTDDPFVTASWTANGGPPGDTGGTYAPATTVTIDPALTFTPAVGVYSYQATYGGDQANPGTVIGACEGPLRVVEARISIDPDDVNRVGQSHTFDVLVEADTGSGFTPVDAAAVTVTLVGDADNVVDTCANGTGDAGDGEATGECSVTFDSDTPGTVTGSASATVTITTPQGNLDVTTSTADADSPTGSAIKRFVDARISIDPDDTNGIGESHTFTVLVEANTGSGFAAVDVAAVTVGLVGDADSVVDNCADGTGDAGEAVGECSVTFTSDTVGTVTGSASATVALVTAQGNINVPVSTTDANSPTGGAVKTFIVGSLSWLKHDAQGQLLGGATFQVCRTHDRFGVDIADECVTVLDNSAPDADLTDGEFLLQGLKLGRWTIDETIPPPGYTGDPFIETIELTLAIPDKAATHIWVNTPLAGATLLIIDEDSIDNGIHFNSTGGLITPDGPDFFEKLEVNDDRPGTKQRAILRYFADHVDETITVKTGQTGDEGWFAPTCIPPKWIGGSGNLPCLEGPDRQTGINNYFGIPDSSVVPSQSRLDKIPAVMPLRAYGLNALVGKDICAVVYDSDISINYDRSTFPFTSGNLQGETLGIVAFTVNQTRTLNGFSSSTLPQVTLTINDASTCNPTELFNAPVPKSSSVPNDRIAPGSPTGYRQVMTFPTLPLFF